MMLGSVFLDVAVIRHDRTILRDNICMFYDELVARDLFQECVCVSPSGVAFSI